MKQRMWNKPWLFTIDADGDGGSGENDTGADPDDAAPNDDVPDSSEQATAEDDDSDEDGGWDVERARRKIRKANAENKNLRERAKKAEAKAASVDDLTRENEALKATNLRLTIATELGIPHKLAQRLNGTTREEIIADAQELLELLTPHRPGGGKPRNTLGEKTSGQRLVQREDLDALAASFMG